LTQEKFERFGNYILLERLASGGMAEIYLSKKLAAEGVQKFVAVKRILSQHNASEDFIRMFKDEAKIAVNLSHANVVSIYDFGVENQQLYLVMEYVEGKNLRQVLNKLKQTNKRFSISHVAYTARQIAAGLDHAHRLIDATTGQPLNIIHRDMSPQNVMVSYEGEVKIIDFGIAKSTTQEESTRVGTLKGKFGYMSPEQVDGNEVDARTDIFALGIMIWEMLSEQRLFLTNNEMTTLRKIRDCKVPSLREIDPNIPLELEKIINKCLARNKAQRFQSASELQRDLQSFLNRYNPDFSSHDFSEFIKENYSEEILDARKRQVAYSKIDVPHIASVDNSVNLQTNTMTQSVSFSRSQVEKVNFVDLEIKKPTDDENFSINQNSFIRNSLSVVQQNHTNPHGSLTNSGHSRSSIKVNHGIHIPTRDDTGGASSIIGGLVVCCALALGAFAFINQTQPQLVASQCYMLKNLGLPMSCYHEEARLASKGPKLRVTSEPEGAFIFINSKATGQKTPADIDITNDKPFTVSVGLAGYKHEAQKITRVPSSGSVNFKMHSTPTGWLVVRVIGGEAFINEQKLENGGRFAVEADKPITLTAVSPITQGKIEKTVTVKEGETQEIILTPR
jgi:eukaryotic-like serine/threonine-protein kinase